MIKVSSKPVLFALSDLYPSARGLPTFAPDELIGCTYLHETENGELICAKVTRKILDRDAANHQKIKFLINVGDDAYEEIMAYNELSDIIERQVEAEMHGELDTCTFQEILAHEDPLSPHSPPYKGSWYNVCVRWSDGSETWEPLNMIGKDDPVTLAAYAKDNDLLEEHGWKFLQRIAWCAKKLQRMLNVTRKCQKATAVQYKFGVRIPCTVKEAYVLDKENGNTF